MNWHFWRRRPDDDACDALNPLLSPYSDGVVSPDEARRVEAHLPDCPLCRQSLLWMQATRRAVAARPVLMPPADLRARIAQGIAASGKRPAPVTLPSARRALALRPALAGAFTLAVLGVAGYSLLESHPAAEGTIKPAVRVATGPTGPVSPPATPLLMKPGGKPSFAVHRHPHAPVQVAANPSPDTAETQPAPDTTKPSAIITHVQTAPTPTKPLERAVTPTASPRPRVIPHKQPALPRFNPSLIATKTDAPKPSPVNVPAPKKPDVNSQVALLPKETTALHTPGPDSVAPQPSPTPEVALSAGPHVQTASLLGPVQEYLRVRRPGVEHLSRSEYTAVRSSIHTAAYTSSSNGEGVATYSPLYTP